MWKHVFRPYTTKWSWQSILNVNPTRPNGLGNKKNVNWNVKVVDLYEQGEQPSSQIVKWSNNSACCINQNNFLSCKESYQLVWLNVSKRSCRLGLRYLRHNLLLIVNFLLHYLHNSFKSFLIRCTQHVRKFTKTTVRLRITSPTEFHSIQSGAPRK